MPATSKPQRSPWEERLHRLELQYDRLDSKLKTHLSADLPDRAESRPTHKTLAESMRRVELHLASQATRLQGYQELVAMLGGVLEAMQVLAAEINASRDVEAQG